jgi:hypothetical protein
VTPYNPTKLCQVEDHAARRAPAATCAQCHSLALLQQRKQYDAQRKKAHEEYLAARAR